MTILVTGATGSVGSQIVAELASRGAQVRTLVRDPAKARFPVGVEVAKGDLTDVDSVRAAMKGVRTLFLLNAVVPDEFTQALIALNLAREAGIERIVYLSVIHSDIYVNVPHFAAKHAVERMIEQMNLPATILRPAYFMNNDASLKDALTGAGVYPMPIGAKGIAMVDIRDIAEVAAIELLRRDAASDPLPIDRIELVGPDLLTDTIVMKIWSDVLGRPIVHAGNDTSAFEQALKARMPGWAAYDMRTMAERFQTDGMLPDEGAVDRLVAILGRPLHTYRDFARETAATW
jgi:uncharacterized protein YbjT (DUF2867 family)